MTILPRTIFVYSDNDVQKITGYTAVYSYKSEGNCKISGFKNDKDREIIIESAADIITNLVVKYMRKHKIIGKNDKVFARFIPDHCFVPSNSNEEGMKSSYSYKMEISVLNKKN